MKIKNNLKKLIKLSFFCFMYLAGIFAPAFAGSIVDSKHNLSSAGPGNIKAVDEDQICIFCHTPHNASADAPLWNRYESGGTYTPYTSSTSKASIGQPTGSAKLCLSCHDGTVAMGMVRSRSSMISFLGGTSVLPSGTSNLGLDISDDHPVSFDYNSSLAAGNPELRDPSILTGAVQLDGNGQLQCTSCHDPHDDQYGKFLTMDGVNSGLCLQCHNKTGWGNSPHKNSSKTWNNVAPDPWPHTKWNTVSENACENCHRPHGAGGKEQLLNYAIEENNCFTCHNGNVAAKDIESEFNKVSYHPVQDNAGLHDPAENALVGSSRHVECSDCHNPHAANDQDSVNLPGSLRLIKGIDTNGTEIPEISYEYELCYRCHADGSTGTAYVNRQYPELNTRLEFDSSQASYHPVEAVGKNSNVPSLISPYTTSSIIKCTDCHNNNQGPNNSGTGPNGPHGSLYSPLLERQLLFDDGLTESAGNYALCYKCHDRGSILSNQSFSKHSLHIAGEGHMGKGMGSNSGTACSTCHDSHGVRSVTHLINFNRDIVSPSSSGKLLFQDLGTFRGRCYLTCHGEDHNPKSYPGGMGMGM